MRRQGGVHARRAERFGAIDDPVSRSAGAPIVERRPPGQFRQPARIDNHARQTRRRIQFAQPQQPLLHRGNHVPREHRPKRIFAPALADQLLRRVRPGERDAPGLARLVHRLPLHLRIAPRKRRLPDFTHDLLDLLGNLARRRDRIEIFLRQEMQHDIGQLTAQESAGGADRFGGGVQRQADPVRLERNLAAVAPPDPRRKMSALIGHAAFLAEGSML